MDILLVEDNPSDAELTLLALRKAMPEIKVHLAEDGVAAQKVLDEMEQQILAGDFLVLPKLILLDIKLPKVDGLDVLRSIKCRQTMQSVPVVMFTSSREERDVLQAYALGVNSYIVKPVNFNELKAVLSIIANYWLLYNIRPINQNILKSN